MPRVAVVLCSLFLLFTFAGCIYVSGVDEEAAHAISAAAHGDHSDCACKGGTKGKTFWCDHCGTGFVDGKKTKCKGCYAAKTGGKPCGGCAAKKAK